MNPDNKITNYELSPFSSTYLNNYYDEEDITIMRSDLNLLHMEGNKYYLTVDGEIHGLYMIQYKIYQSNFLPIFFGVIESGLINNNEIINYEFELWNTDEALDNLVLQSTMITGNLNIYGRKCNEKCEPITRTEIDNNSNIHYKRTDNGLNTLDFNPDCKTEICNYMFAIMGNSSSTSTSKYNLVLKKSASSLHLLENVFHECHIDLFQSEVYSLDVKEDNDPKNEILSVKFLVNSDVLYVVTKDKLCFDFNDPNCVPHTGNVLHPVIFNKGEDKTIKLNGTYYLVMMGTNRANVMIYPMVNRRKEDVHFVKLAEGRTFKNALTHTNPKQYFKFHVESEGEIQVEVHFQANVFYGTKFFLSKNGKIPNKDNYYKYSSNNHLSFKHTESDNKNVYIILLESEVAFHKISTHKIDYSIMYSTSKSLKHLSSNEIFYDNIDKKEKKNFIFILNSPEKTLYLSKYVLTPSNKQSDLIMSATILMDDGKNVTETTISNTIRLGPEEIKKMCENANYKTDKCPFYVTLENKGEQLLHYSLLFRESGKSSQLFDGKEQNVLSYYDDNEIYLYYIFYSDSDHIDLNAYSLGTDFNLYLNFFSNKDKQNNWEWVFPNKVNNSLKYENSNKYFISLKQKNFYSCQPNCILLINLSLDPERTFSNRQDIHFLISSKISQITENSPAKFIINKNEEKVFFYKLDTLISLYTTLLIDVTEFYGDTIYYITVNNDEQRIIPSKENWDFRFSNGHLKISADEIHSLNKKNITDKNAYILIGSYCLSMNCQASIYLNLARSGIFDILDGHVYQISKNKDEIVNFEYFHYKNKSFSVKLSKESGDGKLFVIPCHKFENESFDSCSNYHKANLEISYFSLITPNFYSIATSNKNFCYECSYLISFKTESHFIGSLSVVLENEFLDLQEGNLVMDNIFPSHEQNLYRIKAQTNRPIEISINVFSGDLTLYVSRTMERDRSKYTNSIEKEKNSSVLNYQFVNYDTSYEVNADLYLIVYGHETYSNYSITFKNEETLIKLNEGVAQSGILKPGSSETFVIYSLNNKIKPTLSITLNDTLTGMDIEILFKEQDNINELKNEYRNVFLSHNNRTISRNTFTTKLLDERGAYKIKLSSNVRSKLSYTIAFSTHQNTVIPINTDLKNSINDVEWIYYETYVPYKSYLSINLVECSGDVQLFLANDFYKFQNKEFDLELTAPEGESIHNLMSIQPGHLYLAIHNVFNITQDRKSIFYLKTHLYQSYSDSIESRMVPGDHGKVDWSYEEGKINVIFETIRCVNFCDELYLENIHINYYIILSKNENLLRIYGECGILNHNNLNVNASNFKEIFIQRQVFNRNSQIRQVSYDFKMEEELYFISVVGIVERESFEPVNFYYRNQEIVKPAVQIHNIFYFGLVFVCLTAICLLSLCGYFYYKRYKRVVQSLEYEVKEVDSTGSIISNLNTSIEMQPSQKYQGLMQE